MGEERSKEMRQQTRDLEMCLAGAIPAFDFDTSGAAAATKSAQDPRPQPELNFTSRASFVSTSTMVRTNPPLWFTSCISNSLGDTFLLWPSIQASPRWTVNSYLTTSVLESH